MNDLKARINKTRVLANALSMVYGTFDGTKEEKIEAMEAYPDLFMQLHIQNNMLEMHELNIQSVYRHFLENIVDLENTNNMEKITVVSLGCGYAYDAEVQAKYILKKIVSSKGAVIYTGIDPNLEALMKANKKYRSLSTDRISYNFIPEDARKIQNHFDNVDVVFMSQPEIFSDFNLWKEIVNKTAEIHPAGMPLITTLGSVRELKLMEDVVKVLYNITNKGENQYAVEPLFGEIRKDHGYFLIAEKK